MKKIKKTYDSYEYDELDEKAKQKALEKHYAINVEIPDFWAYDDLPSDDVLKEAGIGFERSEMCFDLDRSEYLYFDTHNHGRNSTRGMWIEDQYKLAETLLKAKVIDKKVKKAIENGDIYLKIDCKHYGGGDAKNFIDAEAQTDAGYKVMDDMPSEGEHWIDKATDWINDILSDRKNELQKVYDGYTSREAIEDTFRANEFTFNKDGSDLNV